MPAPARAFELTLASGFTRGFGAVDNRGRDIADRAGAGLQFELGLGYRHSAHVMIGGTFAYQFYAAGDEATDAGNPAGGLMRADATYHFIPHARVEPWLKVGTGYRYLGECPHAECRPGFHGLELLSIITGADLRLGEQLGVGPMIGAGLDVFLWDRSGKIADPRPNTFVYAGVQMRFDVDASQHQPTRWAKR